MLSKEDVLAQEQEVADVLTQEEGAEDALDQEEVKRRQQHSRKHKLTRPRRKPTTQRWRQLILSSSSGAEAGTRRRARKLSF